MRLSGVAQTKDMDFQKGSKELSAGGGVLNSLASKGQHGFCSRLGHKHFKLAESSSQSVPFSRIAQTSRQTLASALTFTLTAPWHHVRQALPCPHPPPSVTLKQHFLTWEVTCEITYMYICIYALFSVLSAQRIWAFCVSVFAQRTLRLSELQNGMANGGAVA